MQTFILLSLLTAVSSVYAWVELGCYERYTNYSLRYDILPELVLSGERLIPAETCVSSCDNFLYAGVTKNGSVVGSKYECRCGNDMPTRETTGCPSDEGIELYKTDTLVITATSSSSSSNLLKSSPAESRAGQPNVQGLLGAGNYELLGIMPFSEAISGSRDQSPVKYANTILSPSPLTWAQCMQGCNEIMGGIALHYVFSGYSGDPYQPYGCGCTADVDRSHIAPPPGYVPAEFVNIYQMSGWQNKFTPIQGYNYVGCGAPGESLNPLFTTDLGRYVNATVSLSGCQKHCEAAFIKSTTKVPNEKFYFAIARQLKRYSPNDEDANFICSCGQGPMQPYVAPTDDCGIQCVPNTNDLCGGINKFSFYAQNPR